MIMLGDSLLVAPVITKSNSRSVLLPKGLWKDDEGNKIKGPKKIEINVPLERLPYFRKLK